MPPQISPADRRIAAIVTVSAAVAGVAVAAVVYFFNPSTNHFYPVCQFHRLTGLNCPGCGSTRALYALLHGDFTTALRDNALFIAGLAAATGRIGWFMFNWSRGRPNRAFFPPSYLAPLLVIMGVFGVLRNLPAFAFLSP